MKETSNAFLSSWNNNGKVIKTCYQPEPPQTIASLELIWTYSKIRSKSSDPTKLNNTHSKLIQGITSLVKKLMNLKGKINRSEHWWITITLALSMTKKPGSKQEEIPKSILKIIAKTFSNNWSRKFLLHNLWSRCRHSSQTMINSKRILSKWQVNLILSTQRMPNPNQTWQEHKTK